METTTALVLTGIVTIGVFAFIIGLVLWFASQSSRKNAEDQKEELQTLELQLARKEITPEIYERLRSQLLKANNK